MTEPVDVQPVHLVTGEAPPEAPSAVAGLDVPWQPVAWAVLVLVCFTLGAWFAKWRISTPPAERGFIAVAYRLGLRRADRAAVRRLARLMAINEPVALLLSAGAMNRALRNHGSALAPTQADRLRSRVADAP